MSPLGQGLARKRRKKVRGFQSKRKGIGAPITVLARNSALDQPCPSPWAGRELQPGRHSHALTARAGRREWLRFQEAEYKFFEHHSTWAQAQRVCTWFQAELASVHSQAELDFLGHNLQKVGTGGSMGLWAGEGRPRSMKERPC